MAHQNARWRDFQRSSYFNRARLDRIEEVVDQITYAEVNDPYQYMSKTLDRITHAISLLQVLDGDIRRFMGIHPASGARDHVREMHEMTDEQAIAIAKKAGIL